MWSRCSWPQWSGRSTVAALGRVARQGPLSRPRCEHARRVASRRGPNQPCRFFVRRNHARAERNVPTTVGCVHHPQQSAPPHGFVSGNLRRLWKDDGAVRLPAGRRSVRGSVFQMPVLRVIGATGDQLRPGRARAIAHRSMPCVRDRCRRHAPSMILTTFRNSPGLCGFAAVGTLFVSGPADPQKEDHPDAQRRLGSAG